jgi:hypothetical protein
VNRGLLIGRLSVIMNEYGDGGGGGERSEYWREG